MATFNAEPAQMDRLTVLSSGGEMAANPFATGSKANSSWELAQQLRGVSEVGKDRIRAALAVKEGEIRYNVRNGRDLRERFGAGKGPAAVIPTEIASYKKAEDLMRQNSTIALFLQLRSLTSGEQNKLLNDPAIQAELGGPNSWPQVKDKALSTILKNDSFRAMFPELHNSTLSDSQKKAFIEQTLFPADDGRFASRFGTRMQESYKKAVGLELVMTDEQKATLDQQRKTEEALYDQQTKKIVALLTSRGINNPAGGLYTEAQIKTIVSSAFTAETTGDAIAAHILNKPVNELIEVKRFRIDLPKDIAVLEDRLKQRVIAAGAADINAYVGDPTHANEPDVINYVARQAEMANLGAALNPGGARNANLVAFDTQLMSMYQDGTLNGLASTAKSIDSKVDNLKAQITAGTTAKTQAEIDKSHDLRILQEEDLLGEMDGILGQSIADVLEERYDVLEEKMGRMMQEKADKTEKDIKINIMELKRKMSTNWIEYNASTRKKNVKKDAIKRDVTHLAYHFDKEVALKQLIARDLFGLSGSKFEKLNIIDGTNMSSKTVPPEQLLTSDQLKQVEGVFKEVGGEYRDKLFADMFAARGFTDRTFNLGFGVEATWGKLGFKRDEWKYMLQRYEPDITKALEANQETSAALKSLEAQGVKIDINMKWLWYLLAIVFGGTAGMVAAGGPAAILGVKAGLAANSMGAGLAAGAATEAVGGVAGASAVSLGTRAAMNGFSEN